MIEKWIDHNKKEIYFLEWLANESNFTENQILENMKPENQRWDDEKFIYYSINEYLDSVDYPEDYMSKIFDWQKSFLKSDYLFWNFFYEKWIDFLKKYRSYKILFSKSKINYYKFKIESKIKNKNLKSKNLKI